MIRQSPRLIIKEIHKIAQERTENVKKTLRLVEEMMNVENELNTNTRLIQIDALNDIITKHDEFLRLFHTFTIRQLLDRCILLDKEFLDSYLKYELPIDNFEILSDVTPDGDTCSICLATLDSIATLDNKIIKLVCFHKFHVDCIRQWVNTITEEGKFSKTCPTCRREL
jgi:hypothetical protein